MIDNVHSTMTPLSRLPLSGLSYTNRMPFLPPNQQRQSTEGNNSEGNSTEGNHNTVVLLGK